MKRQHCWYCGEDIGEWGRYSDRLDTCGSRECNRALNDELRAERDEAHEQLDRDMGWY